MVDRILSHILIVWLLLKLPLCWWRRQMEAVLASAFGEIAVLMSGGWVLVARLAELREGSPLRFASGENASTLHACSLPVPSS